VSGGPRSSAAAPFIAMTTAARISEAEVVAFARQLEIDLQDPTSRAGFDLAAAINQLNQSERGRRAAVAFRRFLEAHDGSSFSLDSNNWRAIETLAKACRVFGAWSVAQDLPRR